MHQIGCIFLRNILRIPCISNVKLGEEECERCNFHDKHLTEFHGLETKDTNLNIII